MGEINNVNELVTQQSKDSIDQLTVFIKPNDACIETVQPGTGRVCNILISTNLY